MSLNVLLFSQAGDCLNNNPHVTAVIDHAKENQITLVASSGLSDTAVRTLTVPHVSLPLPKATTPTWREACRPVVEAVDAREDIDAILVFDERSLRILTATRVPQKPIIWVGDPSPFAKPKLSLYTQCAFQLTHALFVPETVTEGQVKALCAWETRAEKTLPAIKPFSAETFFTQLKTILANPNLTLPAMIELNLRADKFPFLGRGSRRICHQIGDSGLCIKRYHLPEGLLPEKRSYRIVLKEVTRYAHARKENTSCQEYDYLQKIIKNKPSSIVSAFPDMVNIIYLPTYGWSLIETLIVNHDGSPARLFVSYLKDYEAGSPRYTNILTALTEFVRELATHAITFYDLRNILIQETKTGDIRFRIVDFEPGNRQLFSFFMELPFFIRKKVWRRFHRTLAQNHIKPIQ